MGKTREHPNEREWLVNTMEHDDGTSDVFFNFGRNRRVVHAPVKTEREAIRLRSQRHEQLSQLVRSRRRGAGESGIPPRPKAVPKARIGRHRKRGALFNSQASRPLAA